MSDIAQLENLIHAGHYARARNMAEELLSGNADLRVKQLYALSLSKSGVPEAALEYLKGAVLGQPDDPETMGILGSIYKELFKKNQSPTYAVLARDTYEQNFRITKNYYTGINAATMSVLAGQSLKGKEIAREVLTILKNPEIDFWEAATQAEAFLLLKDTKKAEQAFHHAHAMASTDWGKINSVYNQLWLLNHFQPVPRDVLKIFSPPVVVSFTGHMIDHPERSSPRFPTTIEAEIKTAISNAIRTLNAKIGYCSIACGADILFAEAMEEQGGEVNLYLPFRQDDFIESSVRFAGQPWVDRFMRLVDKHPVTFLTEEAYENHPDLFSLTTSILFGLSCLRSGANHQVPTLLTVLSDKDASKKTGGVRGTLVLWPFPKNIVIINPDVYVKDATGSTSHGSSYTEQTILDRPVLYLVCCDQSTDKKLNESLINEITESLPPSALDIRDNTLIAGFETIFSAIAFCKLATKIMVKPLQQKSTFRTSMHVGPVKINTAEIKQKLVGDSIMTLERLHAITLANSIYATSMVAAILALDVHHYSFDYVDTVPSSGNTRDLEVFRVQFNKMHE